MKGGSFFILSVCLGVVVSSGCSKYESEFLEKECVQDADCPEGYHCSPVLERCRRDCVPDCDGKCCGSDGCGGVCPDDCPGNQSCDRNTCRCKDVLECETNEDCPENYWCDRTNWKCRRIECIPNCTGKCCGPDGCDGTCPDNCPVGYYCHMASCECRPRDCMTDADCMMNQCCIQRACTNMQCGALECGPDPVCGKECGPCPGGQNCRNGRCVAIGDGLPGDPCPFDNVNTRAGYCIAGLECLGIPADGTAGTCPGGSPAECTQLIEAWNIDCVEGNCGASFCAEACDAQGNCPEGFAPQNVGNPPACLCIPVPNGTGGPGDPCPFGDVNAEYDHCGAGLACLGNDDAGPCPGGSPDECIDIPDVYNPDCVNGICGLSLCSEECDAQGNCPARFEPMDVGGTCYCIPT